MKTTTITTIKRTLAPARLIIALALSTLAIASCQQAELPLNDADGTQAGQPLVVTIAPKQAFSSNDGADTRAMTNPTTGEFSWETGDVIYVKYTFDTAPTATVVYHNWVYGGSGSGSTDRYVIDWKTYEGWTGTTAISTMTWPVGAPTCRVQAFYTDYTRAVTTGTGGVPTGIDLTKKNPSNNFVTTSNLMLFEQTYNVGDPIKVNMKHVSSWLAIKGLKGTTNYSLKVKGAAAQRPSKFDVATWKLTTPVEIGTALSSPDVNNTNSVRFYVPLDEQMDDQNRVAIEVIEHDTSSPVTRAEIKAKTVVDGTNTTYHIDGYMYTITPGNGTGSITPENNPDLMP